MDHQVEDEEFTYEFDDIPEEKYEKLQSLLLDYMDGKMTRDNYIKKVEELLG